MNERWHKVRRSPGSPQETWLRPEELEPSTRTELRTSNFELRTYIELPLIRRFWRLGRIGVGYWLLVAGLWGTTAVLRAAEAPAPEGSTEAVMAELREAHQARTERLHEQEQWAAEKERLELLRETIRRETEQLRQSATQTVARAEALERDLSREQNQEQRLIGLRLMLDRLAESTEEKLDALSKRTLPGLVPRVEPAESMQPEARFLAAVRRLDQARRQAAGSAVELVSGTLDGKSETVKLLRLGGVAAWWVSLDGTRSGTARWSDGGLKLRVGSRQEHRSITRALGIAEGSAPPDWVVLPFQLPAGDGSVPVTEVR